MDTGSKVEQSSATSSAWMISSCMQALSETSTHSDFNRTYSIGMSFGLDSCSRMISKRGKMGLAKVRATIQDEKTNIQEYIRQMAPRDKLLNECLRLLKPRRGEEKPSWRDKSLHGTYHRQIEEVAVIDNFYQ